jgi:AraC-like DNA-binding protein
MLSKGLKKLKKAYIFNLSEEKNGELKELLEFAKRDKWSYGELLKLNAFILSFPAKIPECDWSGKISDFRISKLLKIIERDPATTHSNEKLARQIGMSVNAFIRFFKQRTGFAPLSYQIRQRLEKAMILLEHTEKTIEEIAEECGFCDRNYFSKTFKEHTGTPPAQYRKESVE